MKKVAQCLTTCLVLAVAANAWARDLPRAKPERVGMSSERLRAVTGVAQRYVDSGLIPGIITAVVREGRIVHMEAVGNKGVDDPRPLELDDLFRIYSMTKPITAVAAMQLYEQGKFQLNDPVAKFVPELKDLSILVDGELTPATKQMTMQQLLTHTAGLSYGFDPKHPVDKAYNEARLWDEKDLDTWVARLAELPLMYEPGERWHYSVAVDVTGLVVQRLSGQRFDEYLRDNLFVPLGMNDTFFEVPPDQAHRFLPNHYPDLETGKPTTLDRDGNVPDLFRAVTGECRAMCDFQDVSLYTGGAGLVSSTMDYLKFAQMMANGGELNGVRILSPKTVDFMRINHLPASTPGGGSGESPFLVGRAQRGFGFGLGFGIVTSTPRSGVLGSTCEYNWGGAAGTVFWIDPVEDVVVIGMMQLFGGVPTFRSDLKVATYQALTETRAGAPGDGACVTR